MKALIIGGAGQLGRALARSAPTGAEVTSLTRDELDITDGAAVSQAVERSGATAIFNAAAYTAVDAAESDPEAAYRINSEAVGHLAQAAQASKARLIHVSTDFVFAGNAGMPYPPDAPTQPLGVYGASKRDGEHAALSAPETLIVRTAWVYDRDGRNFVNTMLRLMQERDELGVVSDQLGTPTLADDLATALWSLAEKEVTGTLHFTNSGVASWYDFALAIQEEANAAGLLERAIPIKPIRTKDFPTPAQRPSYSVLDCSETYKHLGAPARHWRQALRSIFKDRV
ncbi:dTDP-4-dehydrorhamnose reductase [Erythrobacter litoralis]|uniref:dTDP-4-dehydrorhamnose reductase n=1 Tax=Erythrobacter litoralis TaxID=39960 RepID=UPI0024354DEC|nr:dTDP-4-dehydrorhamnose reductase [Erythrobacter litoralis]MDG6079090.1 dTDP-4-dehydrorhamnose reductase [Erythrobacter litoralis]